jgi:hypothetical protein
MFIIQTVAAIKKRSADNLTLSKLSIFVMQHSNNKQTRINYPLTQKTAINPGRSTTNGTNNGTFENNKKSYK